MKFQGSPKDTPVIFSGTVDTPTFPMDACAIRDEEGYHLFYSTLFCDTSSGLSAFWDFDLPYEGNITKLITGIAYAFSSDQGLTWQFRRSPILSPGEAEWENFRVETVNAIVRDDTLHLFYCADGDRNGKPFSTRYQIGGVSMPLNGKSIRENLMDEERVFARTRSEPLIPYVLDKQSYLNNTQEPSILYNQDHFELFFTGLKWKLPGEAVNYPGQQIAGLSVGRAILNDSMEVQEISEVPISAPINIIEVRRANGKYYMFGVGQGDGGGAHKGQAIICMTSDNGLEWSRPITVFEHDPESGFADWGRTSPTVVVESDKMVLFYSALAISSSMPDDRWGAAAGEDGFLFVTIGRAVLEEFFDE